MRALAGFFFVIGVVLPAVAVQADIPKELEPLSFMLGEWDAVGTGAPGEALGGTEFDLALQGRVIVRKNYAEYPASSGGPTSRHDDLMVIFVGNDKSVQADYYDSEGHVIHYTVTVVSPGKLSFVSEVETGAPRFRLTYSLDPEGLLAGEFEVAPPNQPEAFAPYLTWKSRRSAP